MTMKIKDVTSVIETFAPLRWQESYDNAGLVVGREDDEVHAALLAVDVTEEGVGFGVVGDLPEPVRTVDFLQRVRERLSVRVIRHSDIAAERVVRVALCTGAGASLIGDARRAGAGLYITADLKYNDFMTPDKALTVADIGHFESEYCAIRLLFDILSKNLCTFAVRKSECSRNPVNYLV